MPETLELVINPDGTVTGEVKDISGPDCEKLLDMLNKLGKTVVDRRTPDFYRRAVQQVSRRQSGGRR